MTGRASIQALARGQADGSAIAVPLALPSAARIQERDWEDFLDDPTQLANGLRDLHQAVGPDGLVVTDADTLLTQAGEGLESGRHAQAAVEAVGRLRASLGDAVALVAPVPGAHRLTAAGSPRPAESVQALGKSLFGAGLDALLVVDDDVDAGLSTLANIARFHQGVVAVIGDEVKAPLVAAHEVPLDEPEAMEGLVVTQGVVPHATDITLLEDWVESVRGD